MKQAQFEAIQEHGRELLAIFPNAAEQDPVELCKKLRRLEGKAHRLAEDHCNGVIDSEPYEAEDDRLLSKVNALLGNDGSIPVFLNGDPRGYAIKICDKWMRANNCYLHRDWGGYGIVAPKIS